MKRRWTVARDIVRFMQSIDRSEFEHSFESPTFFHKLTLRSSTKQKCSILPTDSASTDDLIFNNSASKTPNVSGSNVNTVSTSSVRTSSGSISLRRQSSGNSGNTGANLSIATNNLQLLNSKQSPNNSVAFTRNSPPFNLTVSATPTGIKSLAKKSSQDSGNFCSSGNNGASFSDFSSQLEEILEKHGALLLEDYALRDFSKIFIIFKRKYFYFVY